MLIFSLGIDHLEGYGGAEQNDALAFNWIQTSTKHGRPECQSYFGLFHLLGVGCTKVS